MTAVERAATVDRTPPVPDAGLRYLPQWPRLQPATPPDPQVEERVRDIVRQLAVPEKVGQLVQPELAQLRPEDVRDFHIGSALNGAGIWPGGDRHADVGAWTRMVDTFREAAEEAYRDRPFRIPFVWATDAVHGHNNVFGATVFPHNIGLGAARDPDLIRRIGRATAREIAATGIGWTFAPTLTTPRDRRWGHYYEGYSEDPEIVREYARAMVLGLQTPDGPGDPTVLATLKHWIGDGATADGQDRGTARTGEDLLRNLHGAGFIAAIEAGAQVVMASFSSWEDPLNYDDTPGRPVAWNHKVHGSRYLLTDVLKDRMGFDGVVISDWDAHAEIAGCSLEDAGYAITAGIDVVMVAAREAWQAVHRNAVARVADGRISPERLDDAVTRVLRVKMRAGLWDAPPRERIVAGTGGSAGEVVGSPEHQELSREAVRRSLVLLKNSARGLPLARDARVLVTGSGADDIRKLVGGWTLTWQADDLVPQDVPGAVTVAEAVRRVVGAQRCTVDPALESADPAAHDVAVVVLGEDAYAEMRGTLKPWRSLAFAWLKTSYAADVAILRRLRAAGTHVVTVFLTGRPLYVTEEINLSDAFVVAWLPGPRGDGITDVLFAGADGGIAVDFTGRLANSWPRRPDSAAVNRIPPHVPGYRVPPEEQSPEGEHEPLFAYGFGLTMAATRDDVPSGPLPAWTPPEPPAPPPAPGPLDAVTGPEGSARHRLRIGGHNTWSRADIAADGPVDTWVVRAEPVPGPDGAPAVSLRFKGDPAFVYAQERDGVPRDLRAHLDAGGAVQVLCRVGQPFDRPLLLACHDDYPSQPGVDLAPYLAAAPLLGEGWQEVSVPVRALADAGSDLRHVDVPFMIYTVGTGQLDLARVRWTAR